MKIAGILFALLAFVAFALSQALPENAGIEGMVLDAVTGRPLSGVIVTRNAPVRLERPKPELLPDGTPLPIETPRPSPSKSRFYLRYKQTPTGAFCSRDWTPVELRFCSIRPGTPSEGFSTR